MSRHSLPRQSIDFPAWYGEVVRRAGLAESSLVRGAMVIKPYGYAIWEAIQRALDERTKATGHERNSSPMGGVVTFAVGCLVAVVALGMWAGSRWRATRSGKRRWKESGDGRKGAGMNRWPCCFIDGGASLASHVSLARTIATRQLEWGDTQGRIRSARKALALSVRRWNLGVRPKRQRGTAQFRCTACGYGISLAGALPTCPMCRKRAWERIPEAALLRHAGKAVNGTMLWFDEAKDFGFVLTEEGERIHVHRSGFLPGEAPVGRCARRAVRLTATVQNDKRVAIDVSMAPEVAHGRARRRGSDTRSVWP